VSLAKANLLLNAGDWNGDDRGDVITRNAVNGNLELRLGRGDGTFQNPVAIAIGWSKWNLLAAVGDVTGDGTPDVVAQPEGWTLRTYAGFGAKRLNGGVPAGATMDATADHLGIGLWDGDKVPDSMFRVGDHVKWFAGSGTGGLEGGEVLAYDFTPYDWLVAPGDLDGDGHPDLVVRAKGSGDLWVFRGTGRGFGGRTFLAEGFGGYDLAG
jgi:hypothetical protein